MTIEELRVALDAIKGQLALALSFLLAMGFDPEDLSAFLS